jgi:ankyrin repeat protein
VCAPPLSNNIRPHRHLPPTAGVLLAVLQQLAAMAKKMAASAHSGTAAPTAKRRRVSPRPDFTLTGFYDFGPSIVNRRNRDGRTLLHRECASQSANEQPVAIYALLLRGADPTMKDKAGQTALHIASAEGHAGVVRNLLAHAGAHLALATDADGQTPLHLAARGGRTAVVRELLKVLDPGAAGGGGAAGGVGGGAPLLPISSPILLDALNTAGETPLVLATGGEHSPAAAALVLRGADTRGVLVPVEEGHVPLLVWACQMGWGVGAVSQILGRGSLVGGIDGRDPGLGTTALHHAASAQGSPPDVVRALLNAGADVEARDNFSWTPLLYAADSGNVGAVRALLVGGADVNASSTEGETALDLASSGGHEEVVAELGAGLEG